MLGEKSIGNQGQARAAAKRQGSPQSFQQFQRIACKKREFRAAKLPERRELHRCDPNSFPLMALDKFLKYIIHKAEKQSRNHQNKTENKHKSFGRTAVLRKEVLGLQFRPLEGKG